MPASFVGQHWNTRFLNETRVSSDQCKSEYLCRRCEKAIGWIAMGKGYGRNGERHFYGDGCFPEFQIRHTFCDPGSEVIWHPESSFVLENGKFPDTHRRQPQFILRICEFFGYSAGNAIRCQGTPQPDMGI